MWFLALATDYDGTIARDGRVDDDTVAALRRVKESGRKLLLVTGRPLAELLETFPEAGVFDRIVAENGALLYRPETREEVLLTKPADERLAAALRERQVEPLAIGKGIIATWEPNQDVVLEAIRRLGLELEIVFNKGAVMVLPTGVNKASGLEAALLELGLSPHNAAAIGDAENDHAFLERCELSAAVANALPALRERVDYVAAADHGAGVQEFVHYLLEHDPANVETLLERHGLSIGQREGGGELYLPIHGHAVVLAGPSGSGKSTFASALLEQLHDRRYQTVIIDPEGDYEQLADFIVLGNERRPPLIDEAMGVLERPDQSLVVNLIGTGVAERPPFFAALLPRLLELRARTGRPHWIHVDEAHHLLPASWQLAPQVTPQELTGLLLVTVHPEMLSPAVLEIATGVVAIGQQPQETVREFADLAGESVPSLERADERRDGDHGSGLLWIRGSDPVPFAPARPRQEKLRHRRKYAVGELKPEDSFYFTGPEHRLNLRAQNLILFLQIAGGVDDDTWTYHLRRHDFSGWMRAKINDDDLADEVERIEDDGQLSAEQSREAVREAVESRYTAPA